MTGMEMPLAQHELSAQERMEHDRVHIGVQVGLMWRWVLQERERGNQRSDDELSLEWGQRYSKFYHDLTEKAPTLSSNILRRGLSSADLDRLQQRLDQLFLASQH